MRVFSFFRSRLGRCAVQMELGNPAEKWSVEGEGCGRGCFICER